MAWLISKALMDSYANSHSLPEQAAESLAENCLDGEPCALWNGTHTQRASWLPAKTTKRLTLSRSGMTYKLLTDDHGAALLTWFREGFRVNHLAPPLEVETSQKKTCGTKCCGLSGRCSHDLCLPRMSVNPQLIQRQTTLSRWVTRSDALSFRRQTWVQIMCGQDFGYVHTPTTKANYAAASMQKWPSCRNFVQAFGVPHPINQEWLMGWPANWTDLKPLETDKFRQWLQQRGGF